MTSFDRRDEAIIITCCVSYSGHRREETKGRAALKRKMRAPLDSGRTRQLSPHTGWNALV
jgi:hypothetical protein